MSKKSPGRNPDADLLLLIDRHRRLWGEWDRLHPVDEDHPEIERIWYQVLDAARAVVLTPAFTAAGLDGKREVVRLNEMDTGDVHGLVAFALHMDEHRLAAATAA